VAIASRIGPNGLRALWTLVGSVVTAAGSKAAPLVAEQAREYTEARKKARAEAKAKAEAQSESGGGGGDGEGPKKGPTARRRSRPTPP
jgi:hypothetical protein